MTLSGRGAAVVGVIFLGSVFGVSAPANATGSFQQCLNQASRHNGQVPTCTNMNGNWIPSWADGSGPPGTGGGGGIPGVFVFFFVVVLLVGIGSAIWKVTTARTLAKQSGMDTGLATQMALLSNDGLDATYLAANLRQPRATPAVPPPEAAPQDQAPPSVAQRLAELTSLQEQGLITAAEYAERRRAIIDSV